MTAEKEIFLYAVLDGAVVVNVIVGEGDEAGPILAAMLPGNSIVRVTEETGPALIDGDFFDGVFRSQSPYLSWKWDGELRQWIAPTPRPTGPHFWSETAQAWLQIPPA